jgi:hypothetical protein
MNEGRRVGIAIFLISLGAMAVELSMIRVFDFILTRNLSFLIISAALFSLGLAGIYLSLYFRPDRGRELQFLARLAAFFAFSVLLLQPGLNALPFDPLKLHSRPVVELALLLGIYLLLCLPFFLCGLFFAFIFSVYSEKVGSLYAMDLAGAASGAAVILPSFAIIGPGGVLAASAACAFCASAVLSNSRRGRVVFLVLTAVAVVISFWVPPGGNDFLQRYGKGEQLSGGVKEAQKLGTIEYSVWDPVSRIDVLPGINQKQVAYDGGAQATTLFKFDGDFEQLRNMLTKSVYRYFWNRGVLAAHYFKSGSGSRVLVIGAGGGQEVKAALLYGASSVDAVEMVGSVVDLASRRYGDYIGGIFSRPDVHFIKGEGRTFLQSGNKKYDIIQIYSNHTTSSLAAGSGAMDVSYLLTAEAFRAYFKHLRPGGVLQINFPLYPRLVTTAALAWAESGRIDFKSHVLVYQRDPRIEADLKPTFLVKMTPWTPKDVRRMDDFFSADFGERVGWVKAEDPLNQGKSFLPNGFYVSPLSLRLEELAPYRISPATDDRPFFKFVRKSFGVLAPDPAKFADGAVAGFLNARRFLGLPADVFHLVILGLLSIGVAFPAALAPLLASGRVRTVWTGKWSTIAYFSLLGAAFIVIELVLIQKCMKVIGYPLDDYSAVMIALLFSAGCGSYTSSRIAVGSTWKFVFPAILVSGLCFLAVFPVVSEVAMRWSITARIAASMAMIMPFGFFLGMPFPLGIRALSCHGTEAVAWAWGMNGLSTVVGGLVSAVFSMLFGFEITIVFALGLYVLAAFMLRNLESVASRLQNGY